MIHHPLRGSPVCFPAVFDGGDLDGVFILGSRGSRGQTERFRYMRQNTNASWRASGFCLGGLPPRPDTAGRVTASSQVTDGLTYAFAYSYNQAGGLEVMTYPSGRAVNYCSDAAGRVKEVTGYATGIQYAPHGAVSEMTLGNGVVETTTWEPKRMQATAISAVKGSTLLSTVS
jgi:hypothetical protein